MRKNASLMRHWHRTDADIDTESPYMRTALPSYGHWDFPYWDFMNRIGEYNNDEYNLHVARAQLASAFRRLMLKRTLVQTLAAKPFNTAQERSLLDCLDALEGERREASLHLALAQAFANEVEQGNLDAGLLARSKQVVHECCNACIMTMQTPATVLYRIQNMTIDNPTVLRRARQTLRATMRLAASTRAVSLSRFNTKTGSY